jgi:hypothetical protein
MDPLMAACELMTAYNPESGAHRKALGALLMGRLDEAKFKHHATIGNEKVYGFTMSKPEDTFQLRIYVYSSVHSSGEVAAAGADAIRVAAVLHYDEMTLDRRVIKRDRPLFPKEQRVNRTGAGPDIAERMIQRARDVYKKVRALPKCPECGAPKLVSKAGKPYCAAMCWMPGFRHLRTDATRAA